MAVLNLHAFQQLTNKITRERPFLCPDFVGQLLATEVDTCSHKGGVGIGVDDTTQQDHQPGPLQKQQPSFVPRILVILSSPQTCYEHS